MLVYGKQPVYYILQYHQKLIKTFYIAKEIDKKEYSKLMKFDFELKRIPIIAADRMCKNSNHQGFLCDIEEFELSSLKSILNKNFVIILFAITDVGNIGAIIRTAYALGVNGIIIAGLKHLKLEPILRSSTGAMLDIPLILQHNIYDVINDLKTSGFTIYGASMHGKDIKKVQVSQKKALILGGESMGLTNKIISKLDEEVSIKMENGFNSLNVSVAGAILMDRMRDG